MDSFSYYWIGFVGFAIAIIYALFRAKKVMSYSEGTEQMQEIASHIREGANAYLKKQYTTVAKVFLVVFVILLAMAFGIASANKADLVGMAVHAGDHFIYPDCRPEFTDAFEKMSDLSLDGCHIPKLFTPFISMRKQDIAMIGAKLGVLYRDTWSCYKGGEKHCGRCGTCVERKEAFQLAGIRDLTVYEE